MDDNRYKSISNNEDYANASKALDPMLSDALVEIHKQLAKKITKAVMSNLTGEVYVVTSKPDAISVYRADDAICITDNRTIMVRKAENMQGIVTNLFNNIARLIQALKVYIFKNR